MGWNDGADYVLYISLRSCYRRVPLLGWAESRNQFVKILGEVRTKFRFALVGYVAMPEHVHLWIDEPPDGTPSDVYA